MRWRVSLESSWTLSTPATSRCETTGSKVLGAVLALLIALMVLGCSNKTADERVQDRQLPASADVALMEAQQALEKAGGYRLRVQQTNFVLPQWGGSDSGTVEVNKQGTFAIAQLARTGEQGATYLIVFSDGKTAFKRSTCNESFRIPGGGADVLLPYLFARTDSLEKARDARFEGTLIHSTLEGLGPVTVQLDQGTLRPQEIVGTSNGRELRWTFESWGTAPTTSTLLRPQQERGPGGSPC